jgi:argininosuccinate lyase
MGNVIQSFSYGLKEAALVAQAEELAKEQGKSFSKYLVELMREDVQKKEQALGEGLAIMASRQTTINEYDIKLFEAKPLRIKKINLLSKEQKDKIRKDLCQLQKELAVIIK